MSNSTLVYISDEEIQVLRQQQEYYDYLARLSQINEVLQGVNLDEVDLIVRSWKKDEVIRYLLNILKKLKLS